MKAPRTHPEWPKGPNAHLSPSFKMTTCLESLKDYLFTQLESYWSYHRHSLRFSAECVSPFFMQLLSAKVIINLTLNKNGISNRSLIGSVGKSVVS